jgi:hypothetical protein
MITKSNQIQTITGTKQEKSKAYLFYAGVTATAASSRITQNNFHEYTPAGILVILIQSSQRINDNFVVRNRPAMNRDGLLQLLHNELEVCIRAL